MKEKTDISLYNNFQTLLDDKYRTGPKDTAFEEAKENAKMVVINLAKVSKAKGQDAAEMVGLLEAVRKNTSRNQTIACIITERVNFSLTSHTSSTPKQTSIPRMCRGSKRTT
jgi:hypothetical protein